MGIGRARFLFGWQTLLLMTTCSERSTDVACQCTMKFWWSRFQMITLISMPANVLILCTTASITSQCHQMSPMCPPQLGPSVLMLLVELLRLTSAAAVLAHLCGHISGRPLIPRADRSQRSFFADPHPCPNHFFCYIPWLSEAVWGISCRLIRFHFLLFCHIPWHIRETVRRPTG